MAIAGTIIIVNSTNHRLAQDIVLKTRHLDLSINQPYLHVGFSILTEHFLPNKVRQDSSNYMNALYGAISGSARSGNNILADLCITTQSELRQLTPFIQDLDVVWINIGIATDFIKSDLYFNENQNPTEIANIILSYMKERHQYALSYSRWAPELSPIPQVNKLGKIVLLIGCPSAGKSTLSKSVQDSSNDIFLNVGIDTAVVQYLHLRYLEGVPEHENDDSWREPKYNPNQYQKVGMSWVAPGPNQYNPFDYRRMHFGVEVRKSVSAMYATMAEMSRLGFNVISDHCFHYEDSLAEAKHRFQGLPVTYVSLCPSLEIVEQREKSRGDRMNGMGRSIYQQMINSYDADIKLDTGKFTPEEGALEVIKLIS